MKRRKEIYELLYPETKASIGKELVEKRWNKDTTAESAPVCFADDTSKKAGISTRVIHEEIQISKNLSQEMKDKVKEADLSKTDTLILARLAFC